MTDEQVFVSHAPGDLETAQELFGPVRNFPFAIHIALEEIEPGRSRHNLKGRLDNSDVVVAVLTEESVSNPWVNQEVGYAIANGIPVVPLFEDESQRGGYLDRVEGVSIDEGSPVTTIFNLVCRLRAELAPLGALSVPNWYLRFPCNFEGCGESVTLDIRESQKELWRMHEHNQTIAATCEECESRYHFDPATLGFVRRDDGVSQP
jgi:hypothetical protein